MTHVRVRAPGARTVTLVEFDRSGNERGRQPMVRDGRRVRRRGPRRHGLRAGRRRRRARGSTRPRCCSTRGPPRCGSRPATTGRWPAGFGADNAGRGPLAIAGDPTRPSAAATLVAWPRGLRGARQGDDPPGRRGGPRAPSPRSSTSCRASPGSASPSWSCCPSTRTIRRRAATGGTCRWPSVPSTGSTPPATTPPASWPTWSRRPTPTTSRCGSTSCSTTRPRSTRRPGRPTASAGSTTPRSTGCATTARTSRRPAAATTSTSRRRSPRTSSCGRSTASPTSASTGSGSTSPPCSPTIVRSSSTSRRGRPNASVVLVAEPWDAVGAHLLGRHWPVRGWRHWNDGFREVGRGFLRAEPGLVPAMVQRVQGSPDLVDAPLESVNFLACHDGFTLYDLVAYDDKHNEANGWGGRDGSGDNRSWNSGWEGDDGAPAEVLALRQRRLRNAWCLLMMSHGTPMVGMGDESGRTQRGNNNAYNQDNEISWLDPARAAAFADLRALLRRARRPAPPPPRAVAGRVVGRRRRVLRRRRSARRVVRVAVARLVHRRPVRDRQRVVGAAALRRQRSRSVAAGRRHDAAVTGRHRPDRRARRSAVTTTSARARWSSWSASDDLDAGDDEDGVGRGGPGLPAGGEVGQLLAVDRPYSTAWVANADWRIRSAHRPPHHARASSSANVHADVDTVTSSKPAGPDPGREVATGVGLGAVARRDLVVQLQPAVEAGLGGRPEEAGVVAVPDGEDAARSQHPPSLDDRRDRIAQVLQHLVGVDDVERAVVGSRGRRRRRSRTRRRCRGPAPGRRPPPRHRCRRPVPARRVPPGRR